MSTTVTGRNIDIGEALRGRVEAEIETLGEKYFGRVITALVVFDSEKAGVRCTTNVQVGSNLHYTAHATASTAPRAFDQAIERLAKQLRRKKRELHEDKPVNPDKTDVAG